MRTVGTSVLVLLVGLALGGCEDKNSDSGKNTRGKSDDGQSGGQESALPPDPREGDITAVVEAFVEAGRRGEAEGARKLCTPELATQVASLKPRKIDMQIRQVAALTKSADVIAMLKYPDITDRPNEFIVTYGLRLGDDGKWRIEKVKVSANWEEPAPPGKGAKP